MEVMHTDDIDFNEIADVAMYALDQILDNNPTTVIFDEYGDEHEFATTVTDLYKDTRTATRGIRIALEGPMGDTRWFNINIAVTEG